MRPGYTGILFSVDGDYVHDYHGDTIDEVVEQLADRGSQWFFYPFVGVVRANGGPLSRLIDGPYPLEHLKGKAVKTVGEYIRNIPDGELAQLF